MGWIHLNPLHCMFRSAQNEQPMPVNWRKAKIGTLWSGGTSRTPLMDPSIGCCYDNNPITQAKGGCHGFALATPCITQRHLYAAPRNKVPFWDANFTKHLQILQDQHESMTASHKMVSLEIGGGDWRVKRREWMRRWWEERKWREKKREKGMKWKDEEKGYRKGSKRRRKQGEGWMGR